MIYCKVIRCTAILCGHYTFTIQYHQQLGPFLFTLSALFKGVAKNKLRTSSQQGRTSMKRKNSESKIESGRGKLQLCFGFPVVYLQANTKGMFNFLCYISALTEMLYKGFFYPSKSNIYMYL